jgi:hypothetical protein
MSNNALPKQSTSDRKFSVSAEILSSVAFSVSVYINHFAFGQNFGLKSNQKPKYYFLILPPTTTELE